jgi:hypothetical protein
MDSFKCQTFAASPAEPGVSHYLLNQCIDPQDKKQNPQALWTCLICSMDDCQSDLQNLS